MRTQRIGGVVALIALATMFYLLGHLSQDELIAYRRYASWGVCQ